MGSCAAPSAKGDDKFITTDYLQQCPQQREKLMVPFTLLWHKRNSHNPKIVWLRQAINTLCRRLI
ncbi:hypothetical protein KO49_21940 [Salmonella enterica subsp. enterica serovar Senftenberg]|nr:hypothetical protein [Salmonella enterica subsp. enterica serovar Senftenberg]